MTLSLNRYWRLAEAVVEENSRSKRFVVRNRQPVCVGGGPAHGQSAVGAGGSDAVAGATLNIVACRPLVSFVYRRPAVALSPSVNSNVHSVKAACASASSETRCVSYEVPGFPSGTSKRSRESSSK